MLFSDIAVGLFFLGFVVLVYGICAFMQDRKMDDDKMINLKLYLSGPMTGIPEDNKPEFDKYAAIWRANGYRVFSPPEWDLKTGKIDYKYSLKRDIKEVLDSDILAVLPYWWKSKGARLEVHNAQELEIPVVNAETGLPVTVRAIDCYEDDEKCL